MIPLLPFIVLVSFLPVLIFVSCPWVKVFCSGLFWFGFDGYEIRFGKLYPAHIDKFLPPGIAKSVSSG